MVLCEQPVPLQPDRWSPPWPVLGGPGFRLGPDTELVDAAAHRVLVALENPRERTHVLGPYRDEAPVEVASLDLDHPDVTPEHLSFGGIQVFEAG